MPYLVTNVQIWIDCLNNIKSTAPRHLITLPSKPHEPEYSAYQRGATADRQLNYEQRQLYDHDYQQ